MSPVMPPQAGRVHVHSKSTSVGAIAVKPGKTYPLSVLDHAMAKHTIHLVFYFPGPVPSSMHRDRLKESLSNLLSHYPAATGRLARDPTSGNWIVRCNDAGVRVLDADVDVTLDEWFLTADAQDERQLAYWEDMPRDDVAVSIWSPMYVTISEFKDGSGLAIGLSCLHMFADVLCAVLFVKAWADAHRRACITHPPFFHPPALRRRAEPNTATPSAELLQAKSALSSTAPAVQMDTVTFRFGAQAVRAARDLVSPGCPDASPFDVLAALLWWRITQARGPLVVCIDFRKRMYAPLPHGFFGNAVHFSSVSPPSPDQGGEDELQLAASMAQAVKDHIAGMEEEEYWSAIDWVEARRDGGPASGGKYGEAFQMYGPGLTVAMLDHIMAYGTIFDKDGGAGVTGGNSGKGPSHVSCRIGGEIGGEGLVLVMPHPEEEDGRTVVVTLPVERAAEIRRDETTLGLGATLVF